MTYRVEITAEAEREAEAILEWLRAQHAGETGLRWFRALAEAMQSLTQFPERCHLAPESALFLFEVRQLFYGHAPHIYRILFTIGENAVYVLHIRHGRREPVK